MTRRPFAPTTRRDSHPERTVCRAPRWPALLAVAVLLGACSKDPDVKPNDPPREGAFQPESTGDAIDESVACDRLRAATVAAYDVVGCEDSVPECPDFIRPGGSQACLRYSEDAVTECVEHLEGFVRGDSCEALQARPCVVTALDDEELSDGCVVPGAGNDEPDGGAARDGGTSTPEADASTEEPEPEPGDAGSDNDAGNATADAGDAG